MQNKYVGDIGDFGKYGLLRHLCRGARLGVVWYLIPDETANNDGRHVRYLNLDDEVAARCGVRRCTPRDTRRHARRFHACDPELYDALRDLVIGNRREVSAISTRAVLPPSTVFFDAVLTEARRDQWFARALETTRSTDVVFLDPDNGLEVASTPQHSRRASKYMFYDEVKAFSQRGQSLVLYQHADRVPDLARRCRARLAEALGCRPAAVRALRYRRGTARTFLIVPAARHVGVLDEKIASFLQSPWAQHFESV